MEIRPVLIAAMIVVGCGSLGLLAVRLSNPFLKGLSWLAAAFVAGATATALISLTGRVPVFFSGILGNWLNLFAFSLVNAAILELTDRKARFTPFSIGLLVVTLVKDLFFTYLHDSHTIRVETGGVIHAAQALESAFYLIRSPRKGVRVPIWYTASLFFAFAAFNLFRSAVVARIGIAQDAFAPSRLQLLGVIFFLATALGVGFGLFWLTTAKLRFTLERLAASDPLTGVENRRTFHLTCHKERARSIRHGKTFALLVADIDHFKQVNDRYGHMAGDSVLCAIAQHIQSALRASDTLGRWGGEEFVVLLPVCTIEDAAHTAERLRHSLSGLVVPSPFGDIGVTVSFGTAAFQGADDQVDDIFRRADAALYRAKADGRNRVRSIERHQSAEYVFSEQKTNLAL